MGILKLCVHSTIRIKIKEALEDQSKARPTWGDVKHYIENARNLYTKFKIFGKCLGDFDQGYEELVLNNLRSYKGAGEAGAFVLNAAGEWKRPDESTAPLALLTIDKSLMVVCNTISAPAVLSQPGVFSINPDALYEANKTLQECHNVLNSVPIFIAKDGDVTDVESKLYISKSEIDKLDRTIDLSHWAPGSLPLTVEIVEDINDGNSVLKIEIRCNDSTKRVNALVSIEPHKNFTGKLRIYAEKLLDAFENMEVTLKKKLEELVDKRFFICYYPPDLSLSVGCKFKFKYLECGTLKEVLSDSIDDIMYKPVEEDVYAATAAAAAAAATIPYDPREEFFKNIRDDKSYWASTEDW